MAEVFGTYISKQYDNEENREALIYFVADPKHYIIFKINSYLKMYLL